VANAAFGISGTDTTAIVMPSYMLSTLRTVNASAKAGRYSVRTRLSHPILCYSLICTLDGVLSNPQILGVPLLLLANKQDSSQSLSVDEIRHDYEDWYQRKLESARRTRYGEADSSTEVAMRRERIASLDVMGVSAIEG